MKKGAFILKLAGSFALLLLMVNVNGCNELTSDINGTWVFNITTADGYWEYTKTLVFSGGRSSGTVTDSDSHASGDFRVLQDEVRFNLSVFYGSEQWRGAITGSDSMSGTWVSAASNSRGTWMAARKI
jgi:hypothetical protein